LLQQLVVVLARGAVRARGQRAL